MSSNPFRYFKTSSEIIRLAVMLYIRFPLSLRNVEDLLHERGIDVSHCAAGCDGAMSFGVTSLAAPKAGSSSVARLSLTAR